MENHPIDNYFKNRLENHAAEPAPAVWEGIEAGLDTSNGWWRKYLILFLLSGLVSLPFFFAWKMQDMEKEMNAIHQKIATLEMKEAKRKLSTAEVNPSYTEGGNNRKTSSPNSEIGQNTKSSIPSGFIKSTRPTRFVPGQSEIPAANAFASGGLMEKSQTGFAESGGGVLKEEIDYGSGPRSTLKSEDFEKLETLEASPLSKTYPTLLTRKWEYFTQRNREWLVFGYGSVDIAGRILSPRSAQGDEIVNRLAEIEENELTYGGGAMIARSLSPRWRLTTGISYRSWCQRSEYPIQIEPEEVSFTENPLTSSGTWNFNEILTGSLGITEIAINSEVNPLIGFGENAGGSAAHVTVLQTRKMEILTLPIGAEYVLKQGALKILAGGALAANFVISDETEFRIPENPGFELNPSGSAVGTYFSFQAGIAAEYSLNERISLRINPVYQGWMTPVFENEDIRTLPLATSIRWGFVYRLD